MTTNYTEETAALAAQITTLAPKRLLVVSEMALPLAQNTPQIATETHIATPATLPDDSRFDLTCLYHCLQDLSKTEGLALIAQVRDVLSEQVLIVTQHSRKTKDEWSSQDFIAAGFSAQQHVENTAFFYYNIATYKRTPDWLNSKYWANPEQWNKQRW